MGLRFGLIGFCVLLSLSGQTPTPSNVAYKQFEAVRQTPEGVGPAVTWLQVYEQQPPNFKNIPPYLLVARYFVDHGVHMGEIPSLLEKALREITTPGGFTDVRTHSNVPYEDDIDRSMIAALYTRIGVYAKAHTLLDAVAQTVNAMNPANLDSPKRVSFEVSLLFSYRDAAARLAVAEGRKQDALNVEYSILNNPNRVAPRLIQEHRTLALTLWTELGHSTDTFDAWLTGH